MSETTIPPKKTRRPSKPSLRVSEKTTKRIFENARKAQLTMDAYLQQLMDGPAKDPMALANDVAEHVAKRLADEQARALAAQEESQRRAFDTQAQAHEENLRTLIQQQEKFVSNFLTSLGVFFKGR